MTKDEITNLKAKHAATVRDLEHSLKNKLFADALDLELEARNLETENTALAREVEQLRAEGHRLNGVVNIQQAQLEKYAEGEGNKSPLSD